MRIKIQQFLWGTSHSWALVGKNIGRALVDLGHELEMISTDGINEKFIPLDLKPFVRESPSGIYDAQISYTAPHNWGTYLAHGNKNRIAIWNYEYPIKPGTKTTLLPGMAKNHHYADILAPSSEFSKRIFLDMKMPQEKIVVIPHGFDAKEFSTTVKYPLKTKKSRKILLNINQPHLRKNIPAALESFGKAFTKFDDVCLVAKIYVDNKKGQIFDVDFYDLLRKFKAKYKNHAEVEVITDYIPNIAELYNSCDISYTCTYAECWHLPSLESMATGLINIVPNYGGQLHFCNTMNSLLISGQESRCPRNHMYWDQNSYCIHFDVDINDCAQKLKLAVQDYDNIRNKLLPGMKEVIQKYTWENVAQQIIGLCNFNE